MRVVTLADEYCEPAPPKRLPSGPILGIDPHILMGQVGGPQGFTDTATIEFNADADFRLRHNPRALLFGVFLGTSAMAGDTDVVQVDVDLLDIQILHAGVANRCQDAPPVRIGGEQRGLDQR